MIQSLIVYCGTATMMALLGWHVNQREQRAMASGGTVLPLHSWEIVTAVLLYITISSVRWLTSWDYSMYYDYYVSMQSLGDFSRENFEPGFHYISSMMAQMGMHYAAFFGFWAMLHIVLLTYALRHRKVLLPWIALCLFLGPYYIWWMSTIRQAIIECLLVVLIELIVRRRFWLYCLISIVAMLIHKMAILLIPLYFVPLIPVRGAKRWLPYALLVACVVLGSFPQWIKWCFDQVGQLFALVGYGHYYRLFNTDVTYAFRPVIGPARLFPLLTGCIIIWYYPSIKRMFSSDLGLSALFRFSLLHLGYLNLMGNTTQYLSRPGDLMRCCFLVMISYTMCYLWRARKWVALAAIAAINFYYIFYELHKAVTIRGSIYTPELYQTFLF